MRLQNQNSSEAHTRHQGPAFAPLLKVPYPNLTLTLALIYVDRLKAKYPEAKGEAGCSHRLFLTAFIIAAKYRYSVEFSPPALDNNDSVDSHGHVTADHVPSKETCANAELVFSNHAWVRLLNLGSFHRTIPTETPTTAGASVAPPETATTPRSSEAASNASKPREDESDVDQCSAQSNNHVVPIQSAPNNHTSISAQAPNVSEGAMLSPVTPGTLSPASSSVLQVEDLDRMEREFLTFLNGDLATMSHDLETCWNLLMGKR
ncbi:hypothetical protein BGZ94_005191 [Podila epigama]|nr:hypothetical protein BGZ94_005191 [Podila epigama]